MVDFEEDWRKELKNSNLQFYIKNYLAQAMELLNRDGSNAWCDRNTRFHKKLFSWGVKVGKLWILALIF
jgi:hypothetical protein